MESYMMPGFRFYPTEEELVSFYLQKKIQGRRGDLHQVIPELYIYEFNPWDLPQFAGERCPKDPEQWFFFVPRQEKEVRGGRPNRLTTSGFWKATGSPGYVFSSDNRIIGAKRTMVFYKGRAPTGAKTEWKMNEYTAIDGESASTSLTATLKPREEFSLCRVYKRSKCLRAFDRRPSSSSSLSAAVVTSTATISQAHDHHDVDHDWEATPYHSHPQNNHPTRERIITNSLVLTSSGNHTNPISQIFNPVHDNCHSDWAATTYHNHQHNDYPVMERIVTTSPNQSSTGDVYAILNSQTFNQDNDHNPDHGCAATTSYEHQNDHTMMERMIIATSPNQSSVGDAYTILNSQPFNQGNDHNFCAAITSHEHQNDHTMMERMITALPDQSSLWHHGNPNVQTLASAHEHPNCDMSVDNSEDLCDFWEQLNFF